MYEITGANCIGEARFGRLSEEQKKNLTEKANAEVKG